MAKRAFSHKAMLQFSSVQPHSIYSVVRYECQALQIIFGISIFRSPCNSNIIRATNVKIGQYTAWGIKFSVTNFWLPSITITGVIFISKNTKLKNLSKWLTFIPNHTVQLSAQSGFVEFRSFRKMRQNREALIPLEHALISQVDDSD